MSKSNGFLEVAIFELSSGAGETESAKVYFALPKDEGEDIHILQEKPTEALLKKQRFIPVYDNARLRKAVAFLNRNEKLFVVPMTIFIDRNTGVKIISMASYSAIDIMDAPVKVEYSVEIDRDSYSVAIIGGMSEANAVAKSEILRISRVVDSVPELVPARRPRF
ncbi:hypothetical protein M0D48_12525 [Xanthomonas prunicola]|uniref:hypothetical protein n=1 Tax=Xanthomonas prunicola TaxID=2053930 RepID=UPI0021B464CD|nr:hypothetical protein [Xanthomonas prunicola]UXA59870.1 hypothetical protein M0D48_12525 [Xanthomonas prunicola]